LDEHPPSVSESAVIATAEDAPLIGPLTPAIGLPVGCALLAPLKPNGVAGMAARSWLGVSVTITRLKAVDNVASMLRIEKPLRSFKIATAGGAQPYGREIARFINTARQ
jgi:hypothetical protein